MGPKILPKILPKDSPLVNHINDNSKTDRYLEKKRRKREKSKGRNLQKRLKRAQQPGGGLGAYGLLNRKDGIASKNNSLIAIRKLVGTPKQFC